ncbi:tigger transposable element-derived protein 6-like [Anastrepha ludens]|uniref:tigger transposable element-derived protein 6-like n=1 Tax=Anastrepha ludens TaxID=28586 RepID=UPI0023B15980|nr:tigger transposable element-derived protein 6-like [Anastrepha ludens]
MAAKIRMVLLFIDNCQADSVNSHLSHVKIEFLPPNTISKLQPFDMGNIKDFKSLYRKEMVINLVKSIEQKKKFSCTMLTATQIAYKAWKNVSISCIQNCFCACGFNKTLNDDYLEDSPLNIDYLWEAIFEYSENAGSFEEYVNVDNDIGVTGMVTDNDIVEEVLHVSNASDEDDDDAEGDETLTITQTIALVHRF